MLYPLKQKTIASLKYKEAIYFTQIRAVIAAERQAMSKNKWRIIVFIIVFIEH